MAASEEESITRLERLELAGAVYRMPVPTFTLPPHRSTNSFLVGRGDVFMVDAGDLDEQALGALEDFLARDGGRRLRRLFLTHWHPDHHVGVEEVRERTGCELGIHAGEAERMAPLRIDFTFHDGDSFPVDESRLEVIHTPGHSAGHCCFLLRPEGVLFTGDHILGTGTSIVAPPEGDMSCYVSSLARLLDYPIRVICPGHGPVVAEARHKVREYIEHRRVREEAVLKGVRAGLRLPEELVARIYTDVPEFLHGLARYTVQAHLQKLEKEGKVREAPEGEGYEPV
ncbi:MAG: MBL fold metallo-hydrolase [bacterium]